MQARHQVADAGPPVHSAGGGGVVRHISRHLLVKKLNICLNNFFWEGGELFILPKKKLNSWQKKHD